MVTKTRLSAFALIFSSLLFCTGVLGAEETIHILSSGETLYSLSRRYGVSTAEIMELNRIQDPSALPVGTRLRIHGQTPASPSSSGGSTSSMTTGTTSSATAAAQASSTSSYTVVAGDTYYGIARRFGMNVAALLSLNGRSESDILSVGNILAVSELVASPAMSSPAAAASAQIPRPSASSGSASGPLQRVDRVPWWPVAGIKRPLEGKLTGVAIAAEPQSYVHAVSDGNVVWTGPYRGFGHVVLVDSGGYIYLYGGNEDLFVNVGQTVGAGNRIGRLGSSGLAAPTSEMIFSVFKDGVPVSPEDAPRS